MSKVNMEILSEVFPYFVRVNKQFEIPQHFRTGPSQIAMIQSTSFSIALFRKPKDLIIWIWKMQDFRS
jgi:hypothetical protein